MTTAAASSISVGVAGWSYDDWNGPVYPAGIRDKLRYIAPYIDVIEINSSFYHPPSERTAASWMSRTENLPDFFFTAKLHQEITHQGKLDPKMVRQFRRAFEHMADENRLRHLLAQFRYDFDDTPGNRKRLARIRDAFGDMTNLTFELRHASWQSDEALAFLSSLEVTVANLDYPTTRNSFNMRASGVGKHAYMRLHGRNSRAWFDKKAGRDETYNYRYSKNELVGVAGRALDIAQMSKTLTLVANNHFAGKEIADALRIKALLTGENVDVPPELAKEYPDLRDIQKRKQEVQELLSL